MCVHGRVGQTQLLFFLRRILQSKIRNSAAAKARAGPKGETSFPCGVNKNSDLFACPVASRRLCYGARSSGKFCFCRAKRGNHSSIFCSKKVRTSFSNCDQTKQKSASRADFCLVWSGCRESNPVLTHPKGKYYHCTTPRNKN